MGCGVIFEGSFTLDRKLDDETLKQLKYIIDKSNKKHTVKRHKSSMPQTPCPLGYDEQDGFEIVLNSDTIIDNVNDEYELFEWIVYLLKNVFEPYGYTLDGCIYWEYDSDHDYQSDDPVNGKIDVNENNEVTMFEGEIVYTKIMQKISA